MRNVSDKIIGKIITQSSCSINFFENLAVNEIVWKNIIEWGRPQMTIWRMRIACWATKGARARAHTHTHTHAQNL
jgi:hypothetical protein